MLSNQMADCTKSIVNDSSTQAANMLAAKVEACCRRHEIGSGPVVVAISGGPDSVALTRALLDLQSTLRLQPLILAHLNHQLRGAESDADESFVEAMSRGLLEDGIGDVGFISQKEDVRRQALEAKDNLEKVARETRYAWLAHVARDAGARWVVTGHTANDQAETVLHRLLRGAGLKGLRGIAERRPLGESVTVIRPMLAVTRAEVTEYLRIKGQTFREDSSNLDRRLTRNRIRHELLPYLEKEHNPAMVSILCHLAQQAETAYGCVQAGAEKLLAKAERPRAGALLIFDRKQLSQAPQALIREAFRLVWTRENWPAAGMGFKEWERLAAVALGKIRAADFPGGIRAVAQDRVVQLGPSG
jgi:tRNA(Ile)-lysidine synthase